MNKDQNKVQDKTKEKKIDFSKIQDYANPLDKIVQDPLYTYRKVIYTYDREGARRVKRFEKNGWELVVAPSSDGSERLEPVYINEDVHHKAVLMRILKTREIENNKEKIKANEEKIRKSVHAVKKQGYNVEITDHEINDISDLED